LKWVNENVGGTDPETIDVHLQTSGAGGVVIRMAAYFQIVGAYCFVPSHDVPEKGG